MDKLNEQIKDLELKVLDKELNLNELKRQYDILILNETNKLELEFKTTKDSELSNATKRESIVKSLPALKELTTAMSELDLEIKKDKIEVRYLERKLRIRIE